LAEKFAENEPICVVLGDNIIEGNVCAAAEQFQRQGQRGAHLLLKQVEDPERFGCPEIVDGRICRIEEKPKAPKTSLAVTGIYFYDASVFTKIRRLKPSGRGELEVTDINNMYLEEGTLTYSVLDGWWTDAGTFESLLRASNLVAKTGANKLSGQASVARNS
jgi:glucose-1-phosphate thymidylyltransferase